MWQLSTATQAPFPVPNPSVAVATAVATAPAQQEHLPVGAIGGDSQRAWLKPPPARCPHNEGGTLLVGEEV